MLDAWVYIVRCNDGSYYTGSTTALQQRIHEHNAGKFAGYTSTRLPVELVYSQRFTDVNDAIRAEQQIKGWSKAKKEALIGSDFDLLHELSQCMNDSHSRGNSTKVVHPSTSLRVTNDGIVKVERLRWLNSLNIQEASKHLSKCCGSSRWVAGLVQRRPFVDARQLFAVAEKVWNGLTPEDWKEAFSHHPKIGDIGSLREKFASTKTWAAGEQSGVNNAAENTLKALAKGNAEYEEKFGFIFIVCATGKSAEEMLLLLLARLKNTPESEITIAAAEQSKITRIRLEKLLS